MENVRIKKSDKITILFLSWRDLKSPGMGGAEIYTHNMISRLDSKKYRIIHISPYFPACKSDELIDDVRYLRRGNMLSVILKAKKFYKNNQYHIDFVVDQCNTHRFFTRFWVKAAKRIFFIHQLTREIWFKQAGFPLNIIGYLTESPMLRLSRRDNAITVSESTRSELVALGFREERVELIPEGLDFVPWTKENFLKKEPHPTFIFVGRYSAYKGIDDVLKAFIQVRTQLPDARLWILGKRNERYIADKLMPLIESGGLTSSYDDENSSDVVFCGFVTEEKKLELMSRAHLLTFPSHREGWGLIITEAAAVGTPSLVYDAPGTRDAVANGEAGYMVDIDRIDLLAEKMIKAILDVEEYGAKRASAYEFSINFDWNTTSKIFDNFIKKLMIKES